MVSAHEDPTRFAFVPQYVDVDHEANGWQRVPLATSASKMELLEYGHRVRLATSNLPKGRYAAIRVGYLVPAPEQEPVRHATRTRFESEARRTTHSRTLGQLQLQQQELTIPRSFCVDGSGIDNQLTLQVFGAHTDPEEGPSVSVVQAPDC